ncbi:hypothetical protein VKT23_018551 [Stygiomarasmius scandens]|uniref:Nephrocystin 3-like N-terminal domain-containing protein n=1 Tax=Marasmiellus scandens TaxID=2682957 RepID=A0ABR1INS7_9AGAR
MGIQSRVRKLLAQTISKVGALHSSEERFPPPKCHPDTRTAVLKELSHWITAGYWKRFEKTFLPHSLSRTFERNAAAQSGASIADTKSTSPSGSFQIRPDRDSVPIYWLYGPAGVGKSAIAQTLCERFEVSRGGKHLIASFFFSRSSPTRNNPQYLFLTIAYCLATFSHDSSLRSAIDNAIQKHPAILEGSIEAQFHELIVQPLRSISLWRKWRIPKLVIIDGLDECADSHSQRLVLTTILDALVDNTSKSFPFRIPLRFLIVSRPEPAIREIFSRSRFYGNSNRTVLDDSFATSRDIEVYLRDEFSRILETHPTIPLPWPPPGVIDEIVQRASGQFIYASTVLKYVADEHSFPPERLDVVLGLPLSDAEAFVDLDVLYRQILVSTPQTRWKFVVHALAFVLLTSKISHVLIMEQIFELPKGSVSVALRGLSSVLNISFISDSVVLYHKSFADFLQDQRRSRDFSVNLNMYREEFVNRCGERMDSIDLQAEFPLGSNQ